MTRLGPFSRGRVIVYEVADGWRWHLKAGNGTVVADSGEAYPASRKCRDMAFKGYGDRYPILLRDRDGSLTDYAPGTR